MASSSSTSSDGTDHMKLMVELKEVLDELQSLTSLAEERLLTETLPSESRQIIRNIQGAIHNSRNMIRQYQREHQILPSLEDVKTKLLLDYPRQWVPAISMLMIMLCFFTDEIFIKPHERGDFYSNIRNLRDLKVHMSVEVLENLLFEIEVEFVTFRR